eukprot:7380399-Prymnesium_polylepis.1
MANAARESSRLEWSSHTTHWSNDSTSTRWMRRLITRRRTASSRPLSSEMSLRQQSKEVASSLLKMRAPAFLSRFSRWAFASATMSAQSQKSSDTTPCFIRTIALAPMRRTYDICLVYETHGTQHLSSVWLTHRPITLACIELRRSLAASASSCHAPKQSSSSRLIHL